MKFAILLLLAVTAYTCGVERKDKPAMPEADSPAAPRYAEGFSVRKQGDVKWVEVHTPFQGATQGIQYLLVPHGDTVPPHNNQVKVVRIPLTSIVCTSTSHIPLLDYLGESDKLIGFPTPDYISSEVTRKRIDEGHVQDLGIDDALNLERLALLKPSVLMGYTLSSDYGQFKKMEDLGIPVVINAEYLEKHPLGRAEWIKFMALFFNKENVADSVFSIIEAAYNETAAKAQAAGTRPAVMAGIVYGDAWFLPGGQNYAARILKDAGCHYLWEDNPSNGFLELSFEAVYAKAHAADLWIGVGTYHSLQALADADKRYVRFAPFKTGSVYTSDARRGAKGGSEFMELGYLRADLILKDLVKIAHPHLLPDHTLFFHAALR